MNIENNELSLISHPLKTLILFLINLYHAQKSVDKIFNQWYFRSKLPWPIECRFIKKRGAKEMASTVGKLLACLEVEWAPFFEPEL